MEKAIAEIQQLVKELREKWEAKEAGLLTKAEFAEFEKRVNARIDALETALKRPGLGGDGTTGQLSERRKAFLQFLRKGLSGLAPEERKALVENSTGEILVPEELEAEIYRTLPKVTIIRGLVTVRTITTDRIRRRSLTEVQVGWGKLETGAALTESTLVPSEAWQYVEDMYGLTKIGEDELADTDVNLEAIIADSFARAFAEKEDTAFVVGTGHANNQPEGILNGTVVARVNAGQAGAVTADDFIKLPYEVPPQYRRNGVYIVHSTTERALRLLKDSNGQYLWQPSLQQGTPNTFNGYSIYNQDDIPQIPAAGTAADVAIFGDLRAGYRILDRQGITIQRLVELYAESGLVGFKAHRRVGGGVIRPEALRILRVPAA